MSNREKSLGRRLLDLAAELERMKKDWAGLDPDAVVSEFRAGLVELVEEADALEELAAAAGAWYGTVETRASFQAKVAMTAAVERLERVRSTR